MTKAWSRVLLALTVVVGALAAAPVSAAQEPEPTPPGAPLAQRLVQAADGPGAQRHLASLQDIANRNGGNRSAGTPGYDGSVEFIAGALRGAGYQVSTPTFAYDSFEVDAQRLTVTGAEVGITPMTYSPSTDADGVAGALVAVPDDGTPGCELRDYAAVPVRGNIALVRRGVCPFARKQQIAADAGASAVLISNTEDGPLNGTLAAAGAGRLPTAGLSKASGDALAAQAGAPATLMLQTRVQQRTSRNVVAQTRTGAADNVIMAGAHLDSVAEGPGINDNGTGSAALLEVALRLGPAPPAGNAVRFAWWGAEEAGLLGSSAYVAALDREHRLDIAMYLNFDMVGSPNAAYYVYDGDNSDNTGAGPGPAGSGPIERTFADFLGFRSVPTKSSDFDGRSDYGPFVAAGIPSGGLFTGAEGIKSPEQAAKWGGSPGVAFDPCYHRACDTLSNVDPVALDRNIDAMAWTVGSYATTTEGPGGVPGRVVRWLVPVPAPQR